MEPRAIALIALGCFALSLAILLPRLFEKGCFVSIHPRKKPKPVQFDIDADLIQEGIRAAFDGKPELFQDGVHPNVDGAKLFAETACEALNED